MSKNNYIKLFFFIVFALILALVSTYLLRINSLLDINNRIIESEIKYNLLQKQIGFINICSLIILLLIALFEFLKNQRKNLILFSNILFITVALILYVSVNKKYYLIKNTSYTDESGYWLTIFMGVFYILGGILVSTIGYITIRNVNKRKKAH